MSTKVDRYSIIRSVAPKILDQLGAIGRSLSRDVRSGIHRRVVSVHVNPMGYSDWRDFYVDYQAANLLKKYPSLDLSIDRKALAIEKFLKSEKTCSRVNQRFHSLVRSFSNDTLDSLYRARDFVAGLLGDFSWDTALQYCDFGPGGNVGIPRRNGHLCEKIGNLNPTVTGECLALLEAYKRFDPHVREALNGVTLVQGSKAITVPKDARCDRFIAIEPLWNMFFQKGIGGMIRSRLLRKGIDLDNGQELNQRLALRGSLDGSLATIDLSSASDTIALSLVEFLLPEDWYRAMMTVRSPYCTLPDGECIFLRKISSMGNGFTFELETLVFFALVKSISRGRSGREVSVFGDDIILPSTDAPRLVNLLSDVGFSVNYEKSFLDGPFRESCGKHFFSGHDVTPFYLRKEISSYHDLFWLMNSLKRLAFRLAGFGYGLDARFEVVWGEILRLLPGRFQSLSCPDGYGDDAVLRDMDECTPRPKSHSAWVEGFTSKCLVASGRSKEYQGLPALISKLWFTRRLKDLGEMSQYSRVGRPETYRLRLTSRLYPRWSTLGPWIRIL